MNRADFTPEQLALMEACARDFTPTEQAILTMPGYREPRTHTLTLVIQRVDVANDALTLGARIAAALREYAQDVADGHALRGVFERHSCAGCRIDAIQSIAPNPGQEMREDFASQDGLDSLRARLEDCREHADYLLGGDACNDLSQKVLGITPEVASLALRNKLDEALAALPGGDE